MNVFLFFSNIFCLKIKVIVLISEHIYYRNTAYNEIVIMWEFHCQRWIYTSNIIYNTEKCVVYTIYLAFLFYVFPLAESNLSKLKRKTLYSKLT